MQNLRAKAIRLGATEFGPSKAKGKKYYVIYNGKRINFGAKGMSDFTIHKDPDQRARYRKRHGTIKTKTGTLAYKDKSRPAFWSWHILW